MKSLILRGVELLNLYPLFNRYTANTATVFMIHRVYPRGERGDGEISADHIEDFLRYLRKSKYNVISLTEYIDALKYQRDTYKTVVFTVDDGYRDFYLNAYPVFKKFEYPATVFLTSDFIEKKIFLWWNLIEYAINQTDKTEIQLDVDGFGSLSLESKQQRESAISRIVQYCKKVPDNDRAEMVCSLTKKLGVDMPGQPCGSIEPLSWDEVLEMSQNRIEFYPHSKTHPIMTRIPYDKKLEELIEPKKLLEEKLKHPLDIFAYPNGTVEDFDDETIKALRETGYKVAVTTIPGFDNTKVAGDPYRVHRFAIPSDTALFKQYVSGLEFFKDRLRQS
jgi:peptidoglycan/xylan/chitin deacetylase (PgdA/CDA1 family)